MRNSAVMQQMIETALEAEREQHRVQSAREREEITAQVTEEVTARVTDEVTARVTSQVTNEITARVTAQVSTQMYEMQAQMAAQSQMMREYEYKMPQLE
ncbi:hypothetical protein FH972_027235 [Carpinus fangiana]|uniref:Uncharacterized protein n=1 Tax=Carpinus fangiana TaxID=176857 RepID=A0A5N6L6P4_9ROSI|nr:hypothetical protein FH972_027235 [Carpinus fangiana]